MSGIKGFIKKYIPVFSIVFFALFLVCVIFAAIAERSPAFAEGFVGSVGYVARRVLSFLTGILPFSLAELLLMLSPLFIAFIIALVVRTVKSRAEAVRFFAAILSFVFLLYASYVCTLGISYKTPTLESYLQLDECEITADNLSDAMLTLAAEAQTVLDDIEYADDGASLCDKSLDYISAQICAAYDRLKEDYPELPIKNFESRAKPVLMSRGMSAFEILGVYTFFTGESNINTYYPDYTMPFTVAHEFAHQRGIGRENEANFIAFLVCIRAEDPYIRYSGYVNMYEYLASSLGRTDREALSAVYKETDSRIIGEMLAYSEFYSENKNELLSKISDIANDIYLKNQGTEGIISYGLVTKLCIYYFNTER